MGDGGGAALLLLGGGAAAASLRRRTVNTPTLTFETDIPSPLHGSYGAKDPAPAHQEQGTHQDQIYQQDRTLSLSAKNNPLYIFPDQVTSTQQMFTYKCSNWSRRQPIMLDILGQPVFNVRSKIMSMMRERELRDKDDSQILLTIRRQIWTAGPPYYTFHTPTGIEILRLERQWQYGTSRMVATIMESEGQRRRYVVMDGNFASTNAIVRDASTNALLAEFRLHLASWKQTYTVTIQAGVDVALMVGLLVCFDDREGHDFHVRNLREMKVARQQDHQKKVEERRQLQLARSEMLPGNMDGTVTDVVKEKRKALARRLHKREKRFRGAGNHLSTASNCG